MNNKKNCVIEIILMINLSFFIYFFCRANTVSGILKYIFPINSSLWESLKIVFCPWLLLFVTGYFKYGKKEHGYFAVKVSSLIISILFCIVVFYTYMGILGFELEFITIGIYIFADLLCVCFAFKMFTFDVKCSKGDNIRGFIIILLICLCFVLWTDSPPNLGIFWG